MKRTLCFFSLCCTFSLLSGQSFETPLSLISTTGSSGDVVIKGETNTLEWSIGEVITGYGSGSSYAITQGQQQGLKNELQVATTNAEYASVTIFPNPASQFISIDKMPEGEKSISLHNYLGYPVAFFSTDREFISIPTTHLPSGFYVLTIQSESRMVQGYKIALLQQ